MKDIFGVTLEVGQTVAAATQPYRNRYDLVPAKITGFTAKMVRIEGRQVCGGLISPHKLVVVSPKETP